MNSYIKYLILLVVLLSIFNIGAVCANDMENATIINEMKDDISSQIVSTAPESILEDSTDEIIVKDWDDLQYYCSQSDKNYVLKLKEDTNYYPTNPDDESYQIQVNNNVTILGSSGAYFGDSSPNARDISYLAINVPENSGNGITLKGITFKWISSAYQPDAIFLKIAGNTNNLIENCNFYNCSMNGGHSSVIHLMKGDATLTGCNFVNITSDFGCISIYYPGDDATKICTSARMEVLDSYFEGNYARTEPGCINNCGVLVVRNSTFYKNTAFWWAGAIHTHGGANTTIYDSNFTDNLAGWNGGALYTYSYLQIYNTIFAGNNCTTNNGGGAIGACKYLHSPYIYIKDSLFERNENLCWSLTSESTTGTGRGGAISFMDEGSLTVLNTTFIKNSAAMGTAICVITQGSYYGSPNVTIIGNRFINHTRISDVLVVKLDYDSVYEIRDNVYLNNSIEFSKLKLIADDKIGDEVTLHIDASLKNPKYYESDILDKSSYDVYVDGQYYKTIVGKDFTLNLKNLEKCQVYVVPSISTSKSNEVSVGLPKEYIYVSQKNGNDNNNGSSRQSPVSTINKAIELAKNCGNILIIDGTFSDSNLNINYNLTIIGENNVIISTVGKVFNIENADVVFKNLSFESINQIKSTDRIIKQSSGILQMENCTFTGNSLQILIETTGSIEIDCLKFINNIGVLISSNNYEIDSSIFENNVANTSIYINTLIKSENGVNSRIYNSTFSGNIVKDGCIYYNGDKSQNVLAVQNCAFINNTARYSQSSQTYSSGVYADGGLVDIKSSVFLNNTDTGTYSSVIYTSTELHVSGSIFLLNQFENTNGVVINSKASVNLKKIYCDNNWWGNTVDNITIKPKIHTSSNCNSWLFLNSSSNTTKLTKGQKALINLELNHVFNVDENISYYDTSDLEGLIFNIKTTGGESNSEVLEFRNGIGRTVYTLTDYSGDIVLSYNGIDVLFNFTKIRMKPDLIINIDDVYVGEFPIIEIVLPDDVTGDLKLELGNISQTKEITSTITTFNLNDLPFGQYVGSVIYYGDEHYESSSNEIIFNVNRYNSTTELTIGEMEVGSDVLVSVNVNDGATGNITLTINGKNETLAIVNSKATYVINSIERGDYDITATYNGDLKYLSSSDSIKFGVGKFNSTIAVNVENIVYGQVAVFEIILNSTATGNVCVFVDDKNKTSELKNGKAIINISDLNAGNKNIFVTYSGDNIYNSLTYSTSFKISKAKTQVFINVESVKLGSDVNMEINVLNGVTGNVTIICNNERVTKTINRIGKVTWKISDLPVAQYDVEVILNSDNYETVQNSTVFSVSDYLAPQWPNEGYDIKNSGKSPYASDSNGNILWTYSIEGNQLSNLVIDNNGNIYLITDSGIYSIDTAGNKRWAYNFTNNANFSGLSISRDIVISPEIANTLHFINQTNGTKFGHSNIYLGSSLFAPVVDSNANIYISSEYQHSSGDYKLVIIPYKLWENGGNPTLISLGNSKPIFSPVIANENFAVVACSDGIKIIDLNQKMVQSTIRANEINARPVIGQGDIIYVVMDNNIQAITLQGVLIWKTPVNDGSTNNLVLDDESGLYLTNLNGNLIKYDIIDGEESIISNLNFTSGILIGSEGEVYIGCNEVLYAFDNEGDVLWKSSISDKIVGTPVMDKNGIIYVTTQNSLNAIGFSTLKESELSAKVKSINYGENATVTISIVNDATGKIDIEVGSNVYSYDVGELNFTIPISDIHIGKNTVKIIYSGDNRFKSEELEVNFNVLYNSMIIASDVTSYIGGHFKATLMDEQGNVIVGVNLTVTVGSNQYVLMTNQNGGITVDLDMSVGNYQAVVEFYGNDYLKPSSTSSKITILSSIHSEDMQRGYNSGADFKATFLTSDGNLLSNVQVKFAINGILYDVLTDLNGVAILNIKLDVGTYSVTVFNPNTGESKTQKISISKRIVENNDLTMDYLDGSSFAVRIIGDDGNVIGANEVVSFKIGGKNYVAKTDGNGYARLKITLVPKTYTVTAEYKGFKVSNKLVVKQVLKAKNISKKKAKSYKFSAKLKTSNGKAIVGKKLIFKIKGKTYKAKTNKKGVATIKIKLKLKVGKYTITTKYSKTKIKNKLTIKK